MFNRKAYLPLVLLAALFLVTACNARIVKGSGDVVTQEWEVSSFDSIALSGSGEVIVTQNGNESLTVETDDNLMEHLEIRVERGTLEIGFKGGLTIITPTRLTFYVEVDDLKELAISGSGDVESESIESDRLEVTISGSGDVQITAITANELDAAISGSGEIDLAGEATMQDVSISGSGKYQAGELCGKAVEVQISGSGNATVCATETLETDISGSGSVNYYGRPAINSSGSGSGKVNSLGE